MKILIKDIQKGISELNTVDVWQIAEHKEHDYSFHNGEQTKKEETFRIVYLRIDDKGRFYLDIPDEHIQAVKC